MAENEFENLEENNLIDQKELTNDTIESASRQMEEGKNSTAELRKAIDRDAILEEAKKNELYSNMQEICQRMRVDIDGQLIDFFENEDIDLSNIAASIQKGMERIRNRINKSDPYLAFDEAGNFDEGRVREKIGKGPVPEALKQYVEVDKNNQKDLDEKQVLNVIKNAWLDKNENGKVVLNESLKKDIKEELDRFKNDNKQYYDGAITVQGEDGTRYTYNENFSLEFNKAINLFEGTIDFVEREWDDESEFAADWIAQFELLEEALKSVPEDQQERFKKNLEVFKNKFLERAQDQFNTAGFTDKKYVLEYIKQRLNIPRKEIESKKAAIRAIYDSGYESTLVEQSIISEERLRRLDEKVENINQENIIDAEKNNRILRIHAMLYRIDYSKKYGNGIKKERDENGDRVLEKQIENRLADLKKENPEVYEEAFARYSSNEDIDIYTEVLTEKIVLEKLEKYDPNREFKHKWGKLSSKLYTTMFARDGLNSVNENVRKKCIEKLIEMYPSLETTLEIEKVYAGELDAIDRFRENIFELCQLEFEELPVMKKMRSDSAFETETKGYIGRFVNGVVFSMGIGGNKYENNKYYQLLTDKDTKEQVEKRREDKYNKLLREKLYDRYKFEIDKLKYPEEYGKEGLENTEIVRLLSTSIACYLDFKDDEDKNKVNETKTLKRIFVKYIPNAFDKNGILDESKLMSEYETFAKSMLIYQENDWYKIDEVRKKFRDDSKNTISEIKLGENPRKAYDEVSIKLKKMKAISYATERQLDSLKLAKFLKNHMPDFEQSAEMLELLDKIESKNKSCIDRILITNRNNFEETEYKPLEDEVKSKLDFIEKNEFSDNKFSQIIRKGKSIILEYNLNNLDEKLVNVDRVEDEETKKNILKMYLGIKEDIDDEVVQTDLYATYDKRLKDYLKKISPDIVNENGEVDRKKLLEEYNNIFGTDEKNVKNLYKKYENELVFEFVEEYTTHITKGMNNGKIKWNFSDKIFKEEESVINAEIKRAKGIDSIENQLENINFLYVDVRKQIDFSESKEVEEDLVKRLIIVLNAYENENLDRQYLSKEEIKINSIKSKALDMARKTASNMFLDITKEDGSIDLEKFEKKAYTYFKEKNPSFIEGISDPSQLLEKIKIENEEHKVLMQGPSIFRSAREKVNKSLTIAEEMQEFGEKALKENQTSIAYIANVLRKTGQKLDKGHILNRFEIRFAEKIKFISPDILAQTEKMSVSDSLIEELQDITAVKFFEKYDQKDSWEYETDKANKMKNIMMTYSIINSAEKRPDYPQDILERAKEIFEKHVPGGIKDGKVDEEKLSETVCSMNLPIYDGQTIEEWKELADKKFNAYMMISLVNDVIDTRYLNAITKDRERQSRESPLITEGEIVEVMHSQAEEIMVESPGERLAEEISNSEPEIPEISDEEAKVVIESRVEEMEVGSPEEPVIESPDKQISDTELKPTFNKNAENVVVAEEKTEEIQIEEKQEGPKVGQEENRNAVVAESISVDEPVQEDKALAVQEKNVFKSLFNKVSFAMKNIVNNVKEKFGITSSSTESSNNDTTSTSSSSGGVDKNTQESSVKNLTGYDQIQIVTTMNKEKSEENDLPKREEATEERDDEIGG